MATKKTAAKKAAKKTTTKTKYYVAPVPQVVDVNSGDPLIEVVKTSEPADIKFMDASPAFVEVSKKEAVKVERSLEGRALRTSVSRLSLRWKTYAVALARRTRVTTCGLSCCSVPASV